MRCCADSCRGVVAFGNVSSGANRDGGRRGICVAAAGWRH